MTSDYGNTWSSIPLMTAGLGRRGAPTLASLYKPRNSQHELARTQLFEQSAVGCRRKPPTGKHMHVRQAFDFIRECTVEDAKVPGDILHGVFEEQYASLVAKFAHHENAKALAAYERFIRNKHRNAELPSTCIESLDAAVLEDFLMAYINSLEAAVLALEMEGAISMFAEGEQVMADSLVLKLYFPFSDAVDQQHFIDKEVQKEIDSRIHYSFFPFFLSLPNPVIRRLLDYEIKLELYRRRKYSHGGCRDPFYSAKVFRKTLHQANAWFYAEMHRRMSLTKEEATSPEEWRRQCGPRDWSFYEKNAMRRALTKRDAKEEDVFILQTKQHMLPVYKNDFFQIFWELQERERQLSIVIEVEAWVKCHCAP